MERKNSVHSDTVITKVETVKLKRSKNDCLACILKPVLVIGALIGISPISYECPHTNDTLNTCRFKRSKYLLVISAFGFTLAVCMLGFNIYYIYNDFSPNAKDKMIHLFTLVLFEASSVIIYGFSMMSVKTRVKELNGLVAIIANREQYCIDTIFDKRRRRDLRVHSYVYLTVSFLLLFAPIAHVAYCAIQQQFQLYYVIIRGLSSCTALIAQMLFIFQYALKIKVYRHILKACYEKITSVLDEKLTANVENQRVWAERSQNVNQIVQVDHKVTRSSFEITDLLQKLQQMHCAVVLNVKQWNDFLNPLLLITISLSVLLLVMSYYLLIRIWIMDDSTQNNIFYLMEFRTISAIAAMTYLLVVTDTLIQPESEILTFLESFPISKLRPSESLQVEILIMSVRMLRPQVSASGVFNISITLIASITGTIVSYVLVALQFHASWSDQFFGLFPIRCSHENGKCVFQTSKLWIAYSLIFAAINVFHLCKIYGTIVRPFQQDRSLLLNYIASINEYIISFFMLLLIFVDIYRAPRIVRVLNRFVALADDDLLCQNSMKMSSLIQRLFGVTMFLQYFVQFSVIFMFGFLETFAADWSYSRFIMPIIHNTSFLFYSVFGSFCVLSDSILHCFENKICSILNFTSVHPVPSFCSKKTRSALWWKYEMCREKHDDKCPANLNAVEKLEYLQSLYTDLQDNLEALNQAFNPQLLFHISNEVIVMVFQWYAVIVYFTYDTVTSTDNTNNFFHWYYIIIHSWAMCVAMNLAQRVETKIERYKIILLEHSTVVSSAPEHQQLRIFVQTLHSFKGFTASGIFNVNLQISAPICANILMYVLVAIQFKFPKKDV